MKAPAAPAKQSLVSTKAQAQDQFDAKSKNFDVPIDEVRAITLKVSPTYTLDNVESVTLKSFRKVVGYDTFNSILKKDRDEKKDPADYYNITVSMMVKRVPEVTAAPPLRDPYDGSKTLTQTLDKGFPYDDGDNSIDAQTPNWQNPGSHSGRTNVGKLNGENITKEALVNLVQDRDAPVTAGLVQLEEENMKSDADNLSTLFDHNVTRGALKNLVTDKPSPITVGLAQKSDSDNLSTLFDHNVTRGALKNLVTDKPSPITVGLAQKSYSDNLSTLFDHNVTRGALKNLVTDKPSPITVGLAQKSDADNLSTLFDHNVTRGALKNLVTDKPSPITVGLAQKSDADNLSTLFDHNVTRGALKNLVTDKPSPITVGLAQKSDADNLSTLFDHNVTRGALKNLVTDKPSPITVGLAQKSDADNLSTLFDHNVTRGALKNLVTDKPSPITVGLAQKSDADNLSTLFDHNVTRGALKNLVTDKPSPITVGLAQKSDADNLSTLFDHNVTRGALKNLVTDKPSPITVGLLQLEALAQQTPAANTTVLVAGVPVHVNPVIAKDEMGDAPLDMKIVVGKDNITLAAYTLKALVQKAETLKRDEDIVEELGGVNITRGMLKKLVTDWQTPITAPLPGQTWSVAQKHIPAPIDAPFLSQSTANGVPVLVNQVLMKDEMGNATLGLNIRVGGDNVTLAATKLHSLTEKVEKDTDVVFQLDGFNFTYGMLKKLVTDWQTPITLPLPGQTWNAQRFVLAQGVPVLVNPVIAQNTEADTTLGNKILIGPDEVSYKKGSNKLAQKSAYGLI